MKVSTNFRITPILREVAECFEREGYEFYFVGGFVRDTLMISTSKDIDATTNALPSEIKRILRENLGSEVSAMYTVGEKYGTIGLKLSFLDLEITTYRAEQYTEGSRHPEVVFGDNLEDDLARRDFTINAIACDKDANIIDPFGGVDDIVEGRIKFVGYAPDRIREDPLRMLRAIRFSTRYEFELDEHASASIFAFADNIQEISNERIRDELSKMLVSEDPARAIRTLASLRLLQKILPEVDRLRTVEQISPHHFENAYDHTLRVLNYSDCDLDTRLAALLHDTGKYSRFEYVEHVEYGTITTFHGHEQMSARYAHRVLHRLRFPHSTVNKVTHMVACHMRPLAIYNELDAGRTPSNKAMRRFIKACQHEGCTVENVLDLSYADMAGHVEPNMDNYFQLERLVKEVRTDDAFQPEEADSPLDGNELMELFGGKPGPGPWIGATKAHLTNLVVDGIIEVDDKEGAKREALKFWNQEK